MKHIRSPLAKKRTFKRSPSYPGIDLEKALSRAKEFYDKDQDRWANTEVIIKCWGFGNSGIAQVTLAALKKFGLLEDEGLGIRRKAKLSKLALSILRDDRPDTSEKENRIKEAALTPEIHQEVWKEFHGSLPSDENLKYSLRNEREFSDRGAREFIEEFKATIAFAKLDNSYDISSIGNAENSKSNNDFSENRNVLPQVTQQMPITKNKGNNMLIDTSMRTYSLPTGDYDVTFITKNQMTAKEWNKMATVLNAMKSAFVVDDEDSKLIKIEEIVPNQKNSEIQEVKP
jgi:hypothetical protein